MTERERKSLKEKLEWYAAVLKDRLDYLEQEHAGTHNADEVLGVMRDIHLIRQDIKVLELMIGMADILN